MTELEASIARLTPEADKVPELETSKATLTAEKGKLDVLPFIYVLTGDSHF